VAEAINERQGLLRLSVLEQLMRRKSDLPARLAWWAVAVAAWLIWMVWEAK